MKIPLIYGAGVAAGIAVVTLVLMALGYHADIEHYRQSQALSSIVCFAIVVTGIGLAVKAQRKRTPVDQPFGFSKAFSTGLLTAVFVGLFGALVNFAYFSFINPALAEIMYKAHIESAKNAGLTGDKLAKFEADARTMMHPAAQAIVGFLMTIVMGVFISAFSAFIMRRKPPVVVNVAP